MSAGILFCDHVITVWFRLQVDWSCMEFGNPVICFQKFLLPFRLDDNVTGLDCGCFNIYPSASRSCELSNRVVIAD
ncbi:hypothetical protein GHT06_014150 [Daphnia sinensis]|uniref:Uncharacterized protein n=1 Tax=Daphnia sinensis TaxID=1820382 RepID=A0AAD5LCF4_9CRUS|nr:hypothetical protein GHT06_014150 [Daphnia sinensis]